MKKLRNCLLRSGCILLTALTVAVLPFSRVEAAYKPSFEINSDIAYLVNTDTDTVVYEKNADKKTYPASLTKIMTAIVAIESVTDPENVMVTAPAYIYDEFANLSVSTADIRRGETVSMLDLLYALMLPSACEAGSIIADYLGGGDISAFVAKMNSKAQELGARSTHFTNAHGLHDPDQVTTARDMYLIARYAMELPLLAKIADTATYQMPENSRYPNGWYIQNTNWLLRKDTEYYNESVHGLKTGSLPEVGRNLVSVCSQNGYNYLLVTLGSPYYNAEGAQWRTGAFEDANKLYDWVYSSETGFTIQPVIQKGTIVGEVAVELGRDADFVQLAAAGDISALLPVSTDISAIQRSLVLAENVAAPVRKDTVLGRVELRLAGEVVGTVDLLAAENVERSAWLYTLDVLSRFFMQGTVQALLVILLLLILLYLVFWLRYRQRRRQYEHRQRRAGGKG